MLAAERGAASLTLAAYQNDLSNLAGFLAPGGVALEAALSLAEGEPPERVTAWFREWVSSGLFVAIETG